MTETTIAPTETTGTVPTDAHPEHGTRSPATPLPAAIQAELPLPAPVEEPFAAAACVDDRAGAATATDARSDPAADGRQDPAACVATESRRLDAAAPDITAPEIAVSDGVARDDRPSGSIPPDTPDLAAPQQRATAAALIDPLASIPAPVPAEDATMAADPPVPTDAGSLVSEPEAPEPPAEPPRPVFADLGLSDAILRAIAEMGYRHPTPIQAQAIPVVLAGRDVMGVAQTGTGKTAGFTLPMLDILTGTRARARMPRSLILEPTRELALQVAENLVQYGKYLKLTHALIIGGESMADQKDILMKGVDVLIATPGRLIDMFERGTVLLSDTRVLVIDEADRMLDMGFIPDVERIVSLLPANRQTLFFSATMGPEIRRLADAFLRDPKEITVARPASVATTITEGLALVAEHDKREALRRLIRKHDVQNALIFCNRKVDVDILFKSLSRHRFSVGALHGDMAQSVRFATLEKFKAGELKLLVCSDVAARGLDIGGLSHVFNFDVPHHAEDYVHRIGRTGRAGLSGTAFTIAKPDDRFAIEAIEKLINHPVPPISVEGLDPVDWAEADGRRRRGRGKKPAAPAKPAEAHKAGRDRGASGGKNADAAERARRDERPRDEARSDDRARDYARRDERGRDDTRRDVRPREDTRRDDRSREDMRRDDRPRDEARRDDRRPAERPAEDGWRDRAPPRRDEVARDGGRRDRYRPDDLGPPVLGFGDEVPAFMMLRARIPRSPETTEPEA